MGELLAWQPMLLDICRRMMLGIANVEREHAKNRHRVHPQNMFSTLAAKSVLQELRVRTETAATASAEPGPPALMPPGAPSEAKVLRRAQSALQLYRTHWMKERRAGRLGVTQLQSMNHWHPPPSDSF